MIQFDLYFFRWVGSTSQKALLRENDDQSMSETALIPVGVAWKAFSVKILMVSDPLESSILVKFQLYCQKTCPKRYLKSPKHPSLIVLGGSSQVGG